jgi:hypothetical protein
MAAPAICGLSFSRALASLKRESRRALGGVFVLI